MVRVVDKVLDALRAIPVSDLSRQDWIEVGMILRNEGYTESVWERWSRNDDRFKEGECQRKWDSFHDTDKPKTRRSLFKLAAKYGWRDPEGGIDWDGNIT